MAFNNCDSKTNGEESLFNSLKNKINIIFDVGCRSDSEFTKFNGIVHYFDPMTNFIEELSKQKNNNTKSYFNNFGLGNKNEVTHYYPRYQSFYNRINSCSIDDEANKLLLNIRKASDYISENNINNIDFLKIDTEGYELNVLLGFENYLQNVKIIQFEYGGTYLDNGNKLIDVINYLKSKGFSKFSYLVNNGLEQINDFSDHYRYCNIVCINEKSDITPY
jgi:FkbM family methyltransferase